MNVKVVRVKMTNQELDKLEEKTRWSGFPRERGVAIILKLISEIRRLKNKYEKS